MMKGIIGAGVMHSAEFPYRIGLILTGWYKACTGMS